MVREAAQARGGVETRALAIALVACLAEVDSLKRTISKLEQSVQALQRRP
jgi:hypothetical protein